MKNTKAKKLFISGNEAAVLGAIDAGTQIMFGYPITPDSEVLAGWIKVVSTLLISLDLALSRGVLPWWLLSC
jgi:TPP-dependent indolepyruvate ferredoxin oxidoreductase alpha subunit